MNISKIDDIVLFVHSQNSSDVHHKRAVQLFCADRYAGCALGIRQRLRKFDAVIGISFKKTSTMKIPSDLVLALAVVLAVDLAVDLRLVQSFFFLFFCFFF